MNRVVTRLGAIAACAALTAACASSGSGDAEAEDPFTVGFTAPFTGDLASFGPPFLTGFNAAIKETNAAGGIDGRKIKVETLDDKADPGLARNNALKFIRDKKFIAVTGLNATNAVAPVLPEATKHEIPALAQAIPTDRTDLKSHPEFEWVFFTSGSANYGEPFAMVEWAKEQLADIENPKVAIVGSTSAGSLVAAKTLKSLSKQNEWDVVANETVDTTGANTGPAVSRVAEGDPDAILLVVFGASLDPLVKGLRGAGVEAPMIDYAGAVTPDVFEAVNDPGFFALSPWVQDGQEETPALKRYVASVTKAKGDPGAFYVPNGYAQGLTLAEGLKRCGKDCDRAGLKKALDSLSESDWDGDGFFVGPIAFSQDSRVGPHNYSVLHLVDGKIDQAGTVKGPNVD